MRVFVMGWNRICRPGMGGDIGIRHRKYGKGNKEMGFGGGMDGLLAGILDMIPLERGKHSADG